MKGGCEHPNLGAVGSDQRPEKEHGRIGPALAAKGGGDGAGFFCGPGGFGAHGRAAGGVESPADPGAGQPGNRSGGEETHHRPFGRTDGAGFGGVPRQQPQRGAITGEAGGVDAELAGVARGAAPAVGGAVTGRPCELAPGGRGGGGGPPGGGGCGVPFRGNPHPTVPGAGAGF
jgi:hypothetical protein